MNIDSKNRRWPQLDEVWLTSKTHTRVITGKTKDGLIASATGKRTHSGKCIAGSDFNLITYLK